MKNTAWHLTLKKTRTAPVKHTNIESLPSRRAMWPVAFVLSLASFAAPSLARAQLAPPPPLSGPPGTPPGADGTPGGGSTLQPPGAMPGAMPGAAPGADTGASNGAPNGMSTGPANGAGNATEQKLKESESEDSGRGFELFYARAEAGLSYMNLASFSTDTLAIEKSSAVGPMFGLSAGVRFVLFTLGVRARYNILAPFNLWQLNLTAGMQIPLQSFDLGFGLHGGYSFSGKFTKDSLSAADVKAGDPDVSVRGFNVGLGASLDYYIVPAFSVGAGLTAEALFLKRPPAEIPADVPPEVRAELESSDLYKNSGNAAGIGIAGGLRLGLHLGI